MMKRVAFLLTALTFAGVGYAQTTQATYDLVIKGGRVIDPKNGIDAVRDVAIKDGKIAAVTADIPAAQAKRTVNAAGLYVTPGLVDIHVHVYPGEKTAYAGGPLGVQVDAFAPRSCVDGVGREAWLVASTISRPASSTSGGSRRSHNIGHGMAGGTGMT
jgi:dihydroorotase